MPRPLAKLYSHDGNPETEASHMHTYTHTHKLKRLRQWFLHIQIMFVQESYWQNNTIKLFSLLIFPWRDVTVKVVPDPRQTKQDLFTPGCESFALVLAMENQKKRMKEAAKKRKSSLLLRWPRPEPKSHKWDIIVW